MRPAWLTRIVSLILVTQVLSLAQSSAGPTKSPKAVVEEFWKMDTEGGRLSDEGWRAADRFFVRPIERPKEKIICIFDYGFNVSFQRLRDDTAEVIVNTAGTVWNLDPKMRLSICSDQGKDLWLNKLVLTSKHWELAPDHRTPREVSGPPEWRFEKESNYVYLTVETAIRYLSQVRDTTTDPVIKKNAEQSLATLRRHH
jgi:hypothetical protein